MIYWICLFVVVAFILKKYKNCNEQRGRNRYLVVLILILSYFAGFRDGLGMDYTANADLCSRESFYFGSEFLNEPLFLQLTNFCYKTEYSAVILFLICATITITATMNVYSKSDNFPLAAMIFVLYTGLYLQSFNIMRQFVAASIILFGASFMFQERSRKNVIIYILCLLVAFLFHKSSLVMLLVIPLFTESLNRLMIIVAIVVSFLIPTSIVLRLDSVLKILDMLDYTTYLNYSDSGWSKFSMTNIFLHSLLIPFLLYKNKIEALGNKKEIFVLIKLFVCFLVCNNLATSGLTISYRLATYFVIFFPLLMTKLPQIINRKMAYSWIFIPMIILMGTRLQSGDRLTVPNRILPPNSIYDANYRPYVNPLF